MYFRIDSFKRANSLAVRRWYPRLATGALIAFASLGRCFGQEPATDLSQPTASASSALPSTNNNLPATSSPLVPIPAGNTPDLSNPPSLQAGNNPRRTNNTLQLTNEAGQYWEEYPLLDYTQHVKNIDQPEQAVVDWVLRETGTDVWFKQPMGVLTADKKSLKVYHTAEMHKVVRKVWERFVNGANEQQVFGMRLLTVNNPNWRTRAMGYMRSVDVQSPGVHAWLMSKENAAMLLAMLRGRSDFREVQATDLAMYNGQLQTLEHLRSRNYVREFQRRETGWPPYLPVATEIKEGYRLQISPLISDEQKTLDVVVKCNIDQVERLNSVNVDLPLPNGQIQAAQVQVPQIVSWRLHERFRWPADQVLLLSCGVVATPSGNVNNTLLGQGANAFGLNKIVPPSAAGDRSDALLWLEYKGNASTQLTPTQPTNSAQQSSISRGRY